MEEDFDDDLAEDGLPTGHDAVAPGKGILLLPHRQLHPHSQLLKARPSGDQEPRVAILPPHATHSHLGGQDHGEWTYEEQFRQVGCLRISSSTSCFFALCVLGGEISCCTNINVKVLQLNRGQ